MKPIYVLIDKETGDFWRKPNLGFRKGPARTVQAYTSEAKALASLKQFNASIDYEKIEVRKFTHEAR